MKEADRVRMDISSPEGFKSEVKSEIAHEDRLLLRANQVHRGYIRSYLMAIILLTLIVLIIFAKPEAILVWLIAAFILYSFNYIILFLPTTRKEKDVDTSRRSFHVSEALSPAWMLLRQKRRLAIEIGITIFLGGMAPLAASFFIIFGIGLFFVFYFGFITGALAPEIAQSIAVQIILIIFFFIMMLILEPHSQGFTRIASSFGVRIRAAHIKSRSAFAAIIALAGIIIAIVATLFIGAMLLTGETLSQLFTAEEDLRNVFLFALLIGIQIMVMRHFQAVSSRRMARVMLKERLELLRNDVLQPLEFMIAQTKAKSFDEQDNKEMDELKRIFFSIATYDLFELNFFGYSPIYVVGPKVKYILDPNIIPYLGML